LYSLRHVLITVLALGLLLSLLAGLWLVMLGAVQLSLARQLRSAVRVA